MKITLLFITRVISALEAFRRELEVEVGLSEAHASVSQARDEFNARLSQSIIKSRAKRTLNIPEASAVLGLCRSTIYKLVHQRDIPYYKLGSRVLFDEQKLLSWMEARAVEPIVIRRSKRHKPKSRLIRD
jgi:excisionase family DNA binding protein